MRRVAPVAAEPRPRQPQFDDPPQHNADGGAEAEEAEEEDLQAANDDDQSDSDEHDEDAEHAGLPDTSEAGILRHRLNKVFKPETSMVYDQLMWQEFDWPHPTLQWLPQSWQPPAVLLAEQRAAHTAAVSKAMRRARLAAAAAAGGVHQQEQLVPLPLDYQYLVLGSATSGAEPAAVVLCRVALMGQLPAGCDPDEQQVVMVPTEITPVLSIPHGWQDVNRLHLMPSNPNLLATCCDEPQVYLWDLAAAAQRLEEVEAQQEAAAGSPGGADEEDKDMQDEMRASETDGAAAAAAAAPSGDLSPADHPSMDSDAEDSSSMDSDAAAPRPKAVLEAGRELGGFGLQWHPLTPGLLLTADNSGSVQLWDVVRASSSGSTQPLQSVRQFVPCAINDVSWHSSGTEFAVAAANGRLVLQDIRAPAAPTAAGTAASPSGSSSVAAAWPKKHRRSEQVHVQRLRRQDAGAAAVAEAAADSGRDCYCVEYDPNADYRLASGGADGYVCILDRRRLDSPLECLSGHAGSVTQVTWCPGAAGLLASAGEDGFVLLWDTSKMQQAARAHAQHLRQQQALVQGAGEASPSGRRRKQQQPQRRTQAQPQQPHEEDPALLPEPHASDKLRKLRSSMHPGLQFVHHGHLARVEALAWNPDKPWMMASTSCGRFAVNAAGDEEEVQGNTVMLWEVNRSVGLIW